MEERWLAVHPLSMRLGDVDSSDGPGFTFSFTSCGNIVISQVGRATSSFRGPFIQRPTVFFSFLSCLTSQSVVIHPVLRNASPRSFVSVALRTSTQ